MSRKRRDARPRFLGLFKIGERSIAGELVLKGSRTRLTLHDSEFMPNIGHGACIHGMAYTGEHITLTDCRSPGPGSSHFHDGRKINHMEIFPHYVLLGGEHLQPSESCIRAVHFTSTDLPALFYDFDAFGKLIDAKPVIDAVLQERRQVRPVAAGEEALVCYFTGREHIADVETAIGRILVKHSPSYNLGGPSGVYIRNRIMLSIELQVPLPFEDALNRIRDLSCFLSMAAGRRQGIDHIYVEVTDATAEQPRVLRVHPSYRARAPRDIEQQRPHPADVPLDPIYHPEEFRAVLADWLRRHERWRMARVRYLDCLRKDDLYNADRLIAAANMFDILPSEAVPQATDLSSDLAATQNACQILFRLHPPGIDRNSALGALGRLGRPSLPKKVLHRIAIVESVLAKRFPDLPYLASLAVKCRNFLVHGSDEIDYTKLEPFVPFLTDTLEFIFAASDFIEAGWDAQRWNSEAHGWGHNFARYRWSYTETLSSLRSVTAK